MSETVKDFIARTVPASRSVSSGYGADLYDRHPIVGAERIIHRGGAVQFYGQTCGGDCIILTSSDLAGELPAATDEAVAGAVRGAFMAIEAATIAHKRRATAWRDVLAGARVC